MHIREPVVATLEAVGEPLVVEAEQVHDGGLQIVHVDFVLHDGEAEFIGLAIADAVLHAAACEEDGIRVGKMIAALVHALGGAAFAEWCAAEFAAPHDERVVEQTALLQLADERGDGLVGSRHFASEAVLDFLVRIRAVEVPAPVEKLHETHALFEQAAREQAVIGKARLARFRAIIVEHLLRFARDVHHVGHARLHAECEFVLRDARGGLGMAEFARLLFVEIAKRIERLAPQLAIHPGRIAHIQDGVAL